MEKQKGPSSFSHFTPETKKKEKLKKLSRTVKKPSDYDSVRIGLPSMLNRFVEKDKNIIESQSCKIMKADRNKMANVLNKSLIASANRRISRERQGSC